MNLCVNSPIPSTTGDGEYHARSPGVKSAGGTLTERRRANQGADLAIRGPETSASLECRKGVRLQVAEEMIR
jgi:hypothetical protein